MFDLGEGSVANYISAGLALNQLDKIFITHLHLDHFGALPWLNMTVTTRSCCRNGRSAATWSSR